VSQLAKGPWDTTKLRITDPGHIGLMVLDGVLCREVLAADVIATELIGAGELLRPWRLAPDAALLRVKVRWTVLATARVGVIDHRTASRLGAFPEIASLLVERMAARSDRLAINQAIAQLNRVDQRLLTLFWHIAERWGRMTGHGVAIPLTLSHRMLAQLVGARRPTVSTAIGELTNRGEIQRLDDGSWLLTGTPVGTPVGPRLKLIPPRRRMLAPVPDQDRAERVAEIHAVSSRWTELQTRVARLREDCERTRAELNGGYEASVELCRRTAELRDRRRNGRAAA
jgi:hypothetical protein